MCEAIKHGKASMDALMCQNCGAVMVANYDRMKSHRKNGFSYCDKECMYQDKGRIYRTSKRYLEKRRQWLDRVGFKQDWEKSVCPVYDRECKFCRNRFMGKRADSALCSKQCRMLKKRLDAWIASRAEQIPKQVQCADCGIAFSVLTRTNEEQHYCSKRCAIRNSRRTKSHTAREKERERFRRRRGKVSLMFQFRKFNETCQLCGCKVEMLKHYALNQASIDHIVPLSKGGLHVEENLQLACVSCNSKKSNTLADGRQLLLY